MVVAVVGVRMVQAPVHQIVRVALVGDRVVPAPRTVLVAGIVPAGGLGVAVRMTGVHPEDVFIDVVLMGMVQMSFVEVIDVPVMPDGGVTAARPVDVVMGGVGRVIGAHGPDATAATEIRSSTRG